MIRAWMNSYRMSSTVIPMATKTTSNLLSTQVGCDHPLAKEGGLMPGQSSLRYVISWILSNLDTSFTRIEIVTGLKENPSNFFGALRAHYSLGVRVERRVVGWLPFSGEKIALLGRGRSCASSTHGIQFTTWMPPTSRLPGKKRKKTQLLILVFFALHFCIENFSKGASFCETYFLTPPVQQDVGLGVVLLATPTSGCTSTAYMSTFSTTGEQIGGCSGRFLSRGASAQSPFQMASILARSSLSKVVSF